MKKLAIIFSFLLGSVSAALATHIVGGFMSYKYIGGNQYQLTLTVYRDCNSATLFDGDPNNSSVTVASIGLFDISGGSSSLVDNFQLINPVVTNVSSAITNPCLQVPAGVCVEQGVYVHTFSVPDPTKSYVLVYERCCRNGTISNLDNPGAEGATYTAVIPPTNTFQNSSPVFKNFPPPFICNNAALSFDHSATDADGDSLVYSLCTPNTGASSGSPAPNPPSNPPYSPINWLSPYNANDPLGGVPLTIDSKVGYLTGVPNTIGQFVVGVCVSEYRNGILIGTYTRDFQFNVTTCNIPTAGFSYLPGTVDPTLGYGVYEINCTNLSVNFNRITFYNPPPSSVPASYHWDFGVAGTNSDTSNIANPSFNYPDTGTYKVTVVISKQVNGVGCYDTAYALVRSYPTFTADFTKQDVCQDSSVKFADGSVSTTVFLPNAWSWDFGDGGSSSLQNPAHKYNAPGTYNVKMTAYNVKGCTSQKTDVVTINPLPVADFTAPVVCLNQPSDFTFTGSGSITDYSWSNGANTPNTSITYPTGGTKSVSLIVVSDKGCRDTITKNVIVNPLPILNLSAPTTICPGLTTTLSASGGNSYTWSPGTTLSDSTVSNPIATPVVATNYSVTVTDGNGCKNSGSVLISLFPKPNIDAGLDTSVCLNPGSFRDSVKLNATGGVSYVWTPSAGLTNPNIATPTSRPGTNTTYFVTGTDANGCKMTDSLTVYVLDPALNLIVDTSTAICERDTIVLNVLKQGNSSYSWSPNIGISDPNANSPKFFPSTTTPYIFSVQNYCYTKSDTTTIIVHPLPNVGAGKLDSLCYGDTIQIQVTGASTYQWVADPTLSDPTVANPLVYPLNTTTYYVTGIDTFGCKNSDSIKVLVYLPPVTDVKPDTPFICQGQPIQLQALGGVDYLWSYNLTLSDSNISNPIAIPTDTTWYFVKITNIHQCSSNDSIKINVQLPVVANAFSPFDVCETTTVKLGASGGFYYDWTPPTGLNYSDIDSPLATPSNSITYIVKVSNDCFFDTAAVELIIRPLPIVDAGLDTTIFRNTDAILKGTTNGKTYYWFEGTTVREPFNYTTAATPLNTTQYYFYAISEYNCVNRDSVTIFVEPYTVLLLPTAFSPNGDGENDLFRIAKYLNIQTLFEFAVFNRWGEKVFTTNDFNAGWDGTYKGRNCNMEVYTWYVKARSYDGEDILRKGNVTLVR